jgi:hypothetical protein
MRRPGYESVDRARLRRDRRSALSDERQADGSEGDGCEEFLRSSAWGEPDGGRVRSSVCQGWKP